MKTFSPRLEPNDRKWYVVDLKGATLGRVAVRVADILRGKNKPIFSPNYDNGDNVIVVNAAAVKLTGRKMEQKRYYRYSGYPGGLKETSIARMMNSRSDRVFTLAVKRMIPKNRLGRQVLKKLHVYAGPDHPHRAQKPEKLEL
ncbi:MAG: 50S ribosomal protein L13 [bacterium]|nr:50S ribosomal protein L13 [bacterium]